MVFKNKNEVNQMSKILPSKLSVIDLDSDIQHLENGPEMGSRGLTSRVPQGGGIGKTLLSSDFQTRRRGYWLILYIWNLTFPVNPGPSSGR